MSKIWRHYGYFAAWGSHEKRANIKPAPFREQASWSYKKQPDNSRLRDSQAKITQSGCCPAIWCYVSYITRRWRPVARCEQSIFRVQCTRFIVLGGHFFLRNDKSMRRSVLQRWHFRWIMPLQPLIFWYSFIPQFSQNCQPSRWSFSRSFMSADLRQRRWVAMPQLGWERW